MLHCVCFGRVRYLILLLAFFPLSAAGQDGQSQPAPDANSKTDSRSTGPQTTGSAPELATSDSPAVFRVRTNAVLVRVVVRDQKGNAVENLKKEDFQLFDNKKLQTITSFNVVHPGASANPAAEGTAGETNVPANAAAHPSAVPDRFVALVLDDLNFETSDAVPVREAAAKILDQLLPSDRMGIFTTSGTINQDFTSDKAALRDALSKVSSQAARARATNDCPFITYYQADQILNQGDPVALKLAASDYLVCSLFPIGPSRTAGSGPVGVDVPTERAIETAREVQVHGDAKALVEFRKLESILGKLAAEPGQRVMAFVSTEFYSRRAAEDLAPIIDRAVRANIVVDTVDARGLYESLSGGGEAPDHISFQTGPQNSQLNSQLTAFRMQETILGTLLGDLADGTGGNFFHHRNDLDRGIGQAVTAPPVSYVLGFSPQNLKLDGSSHTLKVTLENSKGLSIEARHSYRAPKTLQDPAERADQEILEALTSRDEVNDIPVELRTQFFKKDSTDANLSVLARVNTQTMHFRKEGDRHLDNLTMETAIFDQDGKFVNGGKKVITMNLTDTTLEKLNHSGLSVKSSFDVKPGSYLIRLVLRDTEGAQMAARNGSVEIPF
jgi:VWFA-related protein